MILSSLALILAMNLGANEIVPGQLCITGSPCRSYVCGDSFEAAAESRLYTYASSLGSRFELGVAPSGGDRITCRPGGVAELRLSAPNMPRGGIVRLTITEPKKERTWEILLGERELKSAVTLMGPEGVYEVLLQAEGYARLRRTIEFHTIAETLVAKLEPLPVLAGRVIDRETDTAVVGALIATNTEQRSITNDLGQFTMRLDPDDWPTGITVSAGGYAEAVQAVPRARATATLGDIYVSRGGAVVVRLLQQDAGQVIAVELYELLANGRKLGRMVKSLPVGDGERDTSVKFEGIQLGDYLVLAKGDQEWERLAEPVAVAAAETSNVELGVTPFEVRLQALAQGEPLAAARVVLKNRDVLWQAVVATDPEGKASVFLWQGGRLNATVEAAGILPYMERRSIEGTEAVEWSINIPAHEISGVVVDAKTGQPVPNASLSLSMRSTDGYTLSVKSHSAADGAFRFAPVAYGEHTLKAAARGYPPTEVVYEFNEPEQRRVVAVKLEAGSHVQLTVTDRGGTPIAGARVIDYTALTQRGMGTTDATGTVRLMVPDGQTRDVYVVPRDGSFAFVQVAAGAKDTIVRVPEGVSRLLLRTESEKREPIPNISVVIRHNGRVLPFEVIRALAMTQGAQTTSNADGRISLNHMPAGTYEFWPVGSEAELRALTAGVGPSAPVRIVAAPGENMAVMTFAPTDQP